MSCQTANTSLIEKEAEGQGFKPLWIDNFIIKKQNKAAEASVGAAITHPLYVAIETEDVKKSVSIDLGGLQAVHHKNRGVSMGAILGRRRTVSGAVSLAATTPPPHAHCHTMGRRGAIRVIVVAMITSRMEERRR